MKKKIAATAIAMMLVSSPTIADDFFNAGTLLGSITGGIIGNQIGKGSGNTVATAVGVLLGSQAGNWVYNTRQKSNPNIGYWQQSQYQTNVQYMENTCGHIVNAGARSMCLNGVSNRMRDVQLEAEKRAYECGYWGQCY